MTTNRPITDVTLTQVHHIETCTPEVSLYRSSASRAPFPRLSISCPGPGLERYMLTKVRPSLNFFLLYKVPDIYTDTMTADKDTRLLSRYDVLRQVCGLSRYFGHQGQRGMSPENRQSHPGPARQQCHESSERATVSRQRPWGAEDVNLGSSPCRRSCARR
jgi:hypothetical protein